MSKTKSPLFLMSFEEIHNELFADVIQQIKKFTPSIDEMISWEFSANSKAKKVTTSLLFEELMISFFNDHALRMDEITLNLREDKTLATFCFLSNPQVGIQLMVDGCELRHKRKSYNLSNDTVLLSLEQKTALHHFLSCVKQLELNAHHNDLLYNVSSYIQAECVKNAAPMKTKYIEFYPLLEKRLLRVSLPAAPRPKNSKKLL